MSGAFLIFFSSSLGEQDAAELGANTDANHTCTNIFCLMFFWQIYFFLMLTKGYVFCFEECTTFTKTKKRRQPNL